MFGVIPRFILSQRRTRECTTKIGSLLHVGIQVYKLSIVRSNVAAGRFL